MVAASRVEKKEREMVGCTREVSCKPFDARVCKYKPRNPFALRVVSTNLETRCEGLDEDRKWEVRVKDVAGSILEPSVCKREAGENFGRGGSRDEIRSGRRRNAHGNLRQRPLTKRFGVKGPRYSA